MIDQKMRLWRDDISQAMEAHQLGRQRYQATISVGEMAVSIRGDDEVVEAISPLSKDIADTLRQAMPRSAWPISMVYATDFDGILVLDRLRVSGMELSISSSDALITRETVNWRTHSRSLVGLDRIASDFELIANLTPPSNQPVRAWSTGHTIMGTPHIGHDGVHARSEAEALIKLEWYRGGRKALDEILQEGRLRRRRNDEMIFFVASDLQDLDIDPDGRLPCKEDALDDIARHLDSLNEDTPEP